MIKKEGFSAEKETAVANLLNDLYYKNGDAIIVTDKSYHIVYGNPKAFELNSALGGFLPLAFPEINFFGEELRKLQLGQPSRFSFYRDEFKITASVSSIKIKGEEYLLFLLYKKLDEKKKGAQESFFKPLVQQSPVATAIFSPEGNVIYINTAYGRLFSFPREYADKVLSNYNIFKDKQLIDCGLIPFIEKSLSGETIEIPTILYNASKTFPKITPDIDKYVKGSIFPVRDQAGVVQEIVIVLTDVTYQKQAEQILTEAHLKFQMLNINLPGAIYEYERAADSDEGRFIYMSQGCQEIFEVAPESVMQDDTLIYKMIHPADIDSYDSSMALVGNKNTRWEWEGRVIVNKKIKWIEARSSLRVQPDGKKISYGVLLDVTGKKLAEEQYKTAEERLRLALQSADISLWEWSPETGKIFLNENWINKLGFTKEDFEAINNDWRELIHPQDIATVDKKLNDIITGKIDFFEAEYRLLCKNGTWSWILDKGKAVESQANGKVTKITGTHVDINERKLSEAIIKKNEQLFTQLFDNSPLGIVLLDERHKVIQMNKGFEDLFGFGRKEIVGNALNNVIVPRELLKEAHDINIMTGGGKVGKLESVRKKKNGELIPVIIYGVPVLFNNMTIGIYGIYVDISDRKRAEKELQIRNNELDNFVYKVSHDLRAPLSSILGLVNLANNNENQDDPKTYIDLIGKRVRQLDAFISDVLSHSKNLKLEISIDKINFKEIIESCAKDLSYLPGAERIDYRVNISGKQIYSDRWRINEIIRNLMSNAIKYMNPAQEKPFISINIKSTEKMISLKFADNGLGIEKELQPRIFEMFYRATVHSEGSGIGLYIVKNAIEKLGGSIKVISELQKGTTFVIEIPNRKS